MRTQQPGRGFVLHPLVFLLALLVLGVGAYRAWIILSYPTQSAYAMGWKVGAVTSPVLLTGIAAAIGWLAYRSCGRSQGAANLGSGLVLGAVLTVWGVQIGSYLMNGPANGTQGASNSPPPPARRVAQPLASGRDAGDLAQVEPRAMPPATQLSAPPAELQSVPPSELQAAPPMEVPAAPPLAATPGALDSSPPATGPALRRPPRTAPRPVPGTPNPVVQQTLDALSAELDSASGGLSIQAELVMDTVAKPPAHLKTGIEQRLKDLAALHKTGAELAERLRGTKDEAQKRLKDAGVAEGEAFSASVRYTLERRDGMRAVACEDYGRVCDAAREEAEFLLEHITKWTSDAKGAVVVKDPSIKGRVASLRMVVEGQVKRRDEMAARLRGK